MRQRNGDDAGETGPLTSRSGGESQAPEDWRLVDVQPDLRGVRVLHQGLCEIDGLVSTIARGQAALARSVREQIRAETEGLKEGADRLEAVALTIAGAVAQQNTRLTTLCELHEAGFRELRADVREAKDDARAAGEIAEREAQARAGDVAAVAARIAVAEEKAARVPELGSRLGGLEDKMGESPNDALGRKGSGLLASVDSLVRDMANRNRGGLAVLGAGAAGGGGLVFGAMQLAQILVEVFR